MSRALSLMASSAARSTAWLCLLGVRVRARIRVRARVRVRVRVRGRVRVRARVDGVALPLREVQRYRGDIGEI